MGRAIVDARGSIWQPCYKLEQQVFPGSFGIARAAGKRRPIRSAMVWSFASTASSARSTTSWIGIDARFVLPPAPKAGAWPPAAIAGIANPRR